MTPDSSSWRLERAPACTRILGVLEPGLWKPSPPSGLRTARRFCRDAVSRRPAFPKSILGLGGVSCPPSAAVCSPRPLALQGPQREARRASCSPGPPGCLTVHPSVFLPPPPPAAEPHVALGLWTAWAPANVSDQGRGLSGGDFALGGHLATSGDTLLFPPGVFLHVSGLLCLPQERTLVETLGPHDHPG